MHVLLLPVVPALDRMVVAQRLVASPATRARSGMRLPAGENAMERT